MNENNQNGLNQNDPENNGSASSEETTRAIPASEAVDTSSTEIPAGSHKESDEVISEEIQNSSINENTSAAPSPVYRWDYSEQYKNDQTSARQKTKGGLRNYAIVMSVAFLSAIALLIGMLFIDPVSSSLSALYEKCYPSYVAISVVSDNGSSGAGSGIILTEDGYIATNYHVVDDSLEISVILYDGTTVDADYVDGDEINDIAIIKIAKRGLTPAKIGRSSSVRVGEQVMAIGTPHSINYRGTMTSGYISATNRRYAARNDNGTIQKVVTLLQTDTSVNPGNSGGPLFNMKGEVVGIVSMKIAGSQYEGLGFAIPIDGVIDMLYDIIENGELTISNGGNAYEGAALGVTVMTVSKNTSYMFAGNDVIILVHNESGELCVENMLGEKIPITDTERMAEMGLTDFTVYTAPASGAQIMSTAEGFDSAEKLKENDIIVTANGINCSVDGVLQSIIAACRIGDSLDLEVWRDGEIVSISVELGQSAKMNK